jgi:GNAT superfamily N-acetyltransferase
VSSSAITPLATYPDATLRDPSGYLTVAIPADEWVAGWDLDTAIAVLFRADFGLSLITLGEAAAVRRSWDELLPLATAAGHEQIARATVPADAAEVVGFTSSNGWNWMVTSTPPPPQPAEDLVELVSDIDIINRFLDEANPDASTRPDDPEIVEWAGIADPDGGDRLLAIAATTQWRSGARVLVSVATRPDARGRGLAGAVSAFLVRRTLSAGYPQACLGYYAHNGTAERVYERLGFEVRSRNVSGWLIDRPPRHG